MRNGVALAVALTKADWQKRYQSIPAVMMTATPTHMARKNWERSRQYAWRLAVIVKLRWAKNIQPDGWLQPHWRQDQSVDDQIRYRQTCAATPDT